MRPRQLKQRAAAAAAVADGRHLQVGARRARRARQLHREQPHAPLAARRGRDDGVAEARGRQISETARVRHRELVGKAEHLAAAAGLAHDVADGEDVALHVGAPQRERRGRALRGLAVVGDEVGGRARQPAAALDRGRQKVARGLQLLLLARCAGAAAVLIH